jgi:Raf kinase inhibitor-like YbhB/YbcL family protein
MILSSKSFVHGSAIPAKNAFAMPDAAAHFRFSDNANPHLAWEGAPANTRAFVVICTDYCAPSRGDDVNVEGRTVPKSLPRVDFQHWALIGLPATVCEIAEGAHSSKVTAGGKSGPDAPAGYQHGMNDYTGWFAGHPDLKGNYYGYDGPAPPWNDELVHRYAFTVYALSAPLADLGDRFTVTDVLRAMRGLVLDQATIEGTYTLNPALGAGA